ncbi:MAG TPA: POTRA domain-containing protein [Stellaceae bacterium]|nr:POTRA domain-containing protein [Stellaceae bacterium]
MSDVSRAGSAGSWRLRLLGGLSLAALLWAGDAPAQVSPTPFPGQPEPGRNVPPPSPAPRQQFEFSIPAPQRGPVPRAVDEIEFDVSDIKVEGAKMFPPEAFRPLYQPLIGTKAHLSDVIGVADKIEALYRAHGYVLTRAYVPPQTVSGGVFQINVVEGYVKATAVSGGDDATRERVESYIQPVTQERPATLSTMERGLLMSNELPGTTAAGLLRPSPTEPGASDLLVTLQEEPWNLTFYTDNRGAAVTGPWTIGAQGVVNNLVPYAPGQFMVDFSGTPGFETRNLLQARYVRPIGLDGMLLTFQGVHAHGEPAALGGNLVSDSNAMGARLSYPLMVSRPTRLTVEGGVTIQEATVQTATPPSPIPGGGAPPATFDDDHWREVDVALTWEQRGLIYDSSTAATIGVTQGIGLFGARSTSPFNATLNPPPYPGAAAGGSTGFTKYTLVVTHDQPLQGPLSANFRVLGQWSVERLVIGEETSFGGSGIGRGYDPAALAGDAGLGIASEIRYDMHFPEYKIDTAQFYFFMDAATINPRHGDEAIPPAGITQRDSLLSTGIGVRVALLQRVTGGIEFAQELRGVPNNDMGKTGARFLFNAAVRF